MALNLPKQKMAQHIKVDSYPSLISDVLQYNEQLIHNGVDLGRDEYYIIKDFQFVNKADMKIHIGHISNLIMKDVLVKRMLSKSCIAYLYTEYHNPELEAYAKDFGIFMNICENIERSTELEILAQDRSCKFIDSSKMDRRTNLFSHKNDHIKIYEAYGPDAIRMCVLLSTDKKCLKISENRLEEALVCVSKIINYTRYLVNNLYLENHDLGNIPPETSYKMRKLKEGFDYFINLSQFDKAIKLLIKFLSDYSKHMDKYFKMEFYEMDLSDPMRQSIEDEFYYIATKIQKLTYCILPFLSTELKLKIQKII